MSDKETRKRRGSVIARSWVPDQKLRHDRRACVELSSIKHVDGKQPIVVPSRLLIFTAHCGEFSLRVLLDSGAQANFISATAVQKASLQKRCLATPMYVRHSNGVEIQVTTEVPGVELVFQRNALCVNCIEIPNLNYDGILGQV